MSIQTVTPAVLETWPAEDYILIDVRDESAYQLGNIPGSIRIARQDLLDGRFQHCLKNLIVNFDMISDMSDGVIRFRNGEEVAIGRGNYIKAKQKFAMYIKNHKKTLAKAADL